MVAASLSFLGTFAALISKHPFHVPAASSQKELAPPKVLSGPSWEYHNPEIDRLILDLRNEKEAVARRQAELNEFETRLKSQRNELTVITQRVFQFQQDFDKSVVRIREDEVINLKRLSKMYASMSPEGAANIFKEMEDDQIVKQLTQMKEAEVGPILESLGKERPQAAMSKRVANITNKLRIASTKPVPAKSKSQ